MINLAPPQIEYLRRLVRMDIRKIRKGTRALMRKYGDEYDAGHKDETVEFARQVYCVLGGDPNTITEGLM